MRTRNRHLALAAALGLAGLGIGIGIGFVFGQDQEKHSGGDPADELFDLAASMNTILASIASDIHVQRYASALAACNDAIDYYTVELDSLAPAESELRNWLSTTLSVVARYRTRFPSAFAPSDERRARANDILLSAIAKPDDEMLRRAETGDRKWQVKLAQAYEGLGTRADAIYWFGRAADSGSMLAKTSLALLHAFGREGDRNEAEALRLLIELTELGDVQASYFVGLLYENGRDIERDLVTAYKFYLVADLMMGGDVDALRAMERLRQRLREDDILEAERRSAAFIKALE